MSQILSSSKTFPQKADVVIIGGGVLGTSIAWNLAKRGCNDIVILERDLLGSGSTAKAAGGVRQQFSTKANIRLCIYSVDFFKHFNQRLGMEPDETGANFKQVGYLFLITRPEDMEAFKRNVALQQSLGVPVEVLTNEQVSTRWDFLMTEDVIGATFCPTDGYASTTDVVFAYARQARKMGVKVWENTEVTAIKRRGRELHSVETNRGEISAGIVVGCAGAWSSILGEMLDVEIPVEPVKRQAFFTEPFSEIPAQIPFVIDMLNGFHFRREGLGFLMGESDLTQKPGFDITLDWNWLETVAEHAMYRVPALERARILSGWAGLYDTSPDHNGIIGKVPELDNFYLATGFSGHGFMQSPAVGLSISELIIDGEIKTVDVAELNIERFRTGNYNRERNVL